jgi:hypothetical protein
MGIEEVPGGEGGEGDKELERGMFFIPKNYVYNFYNYLHNKAICS